MNPSELVRVLDGSFEQVLARVPSALQTQGFGVLTTIDVKATLKAKLNADLAPYTILGACNPHMAHQALQLDPTLGVNLPCNVVVRDLGQNKVEVRAVDPVQTLGTGRTPELGPLAEKVRQMLVQALQAL